MIFLTILWIDILERVNKTNQFLQSEDVNILVATNLLVFRKKGNERQVFLLLDIMNQKKRYFSVKVKISQWKYSFLF